mmetsp:Transcript_81613/g.231415  ORF Transcript_81613/g.231415 Transcript_81613/m.231415 type:complete len:242 (+) Transcript_81613:569-1294(+)
MLRLLRLSAAKFHGDPVVPLAALQLIAFGTNCELEAAHACRCEALLVARDTPTTQQAVGLDAITPGAANSLYSRDIDIAEGSINGDGAREGPVVEHVRQGAGGRHRRTRLRGTREWQAGLAVCARIGLISATGSRAGAVTPAFPHTGFCTLASRCSGCFVVAAARASTSAVRAHGDALHLTTGLHSHVFKFLQRMCHCIRMPHLVARLAPLRRVSLSFLLPHWDQKNEKMGGGIRANVIGC